MKMKMVQAIFFFASVFSFMSFFFCVFFLSHLLLWFWLGLGRAKARPKIWPADHGFWVARPDPGHILGGPTQPEPKKLHFYQKNWSKMGQNRQPEQARGQIRPPWAQPGPKKASPNPTRARNKVTRPSPSFDHFEHLEHFEHRIIIDSCASPSDNLI